jgi:phage terminase large subunit
LLKIDAFNIGPMAAQANRERVSAKLESFRDIRIGGTCPDDVIIKGVRGGRGAGAKSWGVISLNVQEANYFTERYACFREIQNTLNESVYQLIENTVERLLYPGWRFTNERIISPTGSEFIFRGLKDLTASRNVKGLEGFTRFLIEEAASISVESWDYLLPTLFRNQKAKLWFVYNQDLETDPVTTKVWNVFREEEYARLIECAPGKFDNPWWNDHLEKLSVKLKEIDPDLWDHVYGGNPRSQLFNAAISRILVRQAMDRGIIDPEGAEEVGCDPADMGDDKTEIYHRKGHKIIGHKELRKMDGEFIANEIWAMIDKRPYVPIKVDVTGIGTSTRDNLRRLGAKVVSVNFGEGALKSDEFPNIVSEMWFNFKDVLPFIDIPDDPELMSDLSSRLYDYDTKGRRCIESKKKFKERFNRSPDKGDAMLLCFYSGRNMTISKESQQELAARRSR